MAASHVITYDVMHRLLVEPDIGSGCLDKNFPTQAFNVSFVAIFGSIRSAVGLNFLDIYRTCSVPETG